MEKYDDIINLPHHVSKKHLQMSLHDRAAQFAPFAALTGYDEEVKEVSRITDQFHPLESKKKEEINQKLCILQEIQYEPPRRMNMKNGEKIPMKYIIELEGDVFAGISF